MAAFVVGLLVCWVLLVSDVRTLAARVPTAPQSDMPADMPGMRR